MRRVLALALGALAAVTPLVPTAAASSDEAWDPATTRISLEPFAEGLPEPIFVTHAGEDDEALYVIGRQGILLRVEPDGSVHDPPLLDIRDRVRTEHQDQGLVALAFHPRFDENGRLFLYYTREPDGAVVVGEFLAGPHGIAPESERIRLVIPHLDSVHNGGMLAFDAAGRLLISSGDGGYAAYGTGLSQDPETLLGKLLRMDVDGAGADSEEGDDDGLPVEMVARGLRNPWRFSIDPLDGTIIIGDTGRRRWEEIDIVPRAIAGRNFGWDQVEGMVCTEVAPDCDPSAYVAPALTYPNEPGGAVIGGYVYRGSSAPALEGVYIFGDLLGAIYGVPMSELLAGGAVPHELARIPEPGYLWSFGQDAAGELYVVMGSGSILRLLVEPS